MPPRPRTKPALFDLNDDLPNDAEIEQCFEERIITQNGLSMTILDFDCGCAFTAWTERDFEEIENIVNANECPHCGYSSTPKIEYKKPLPKAAPTAPTPRKMVTAKTKFGSITLDVETGRFNDEDETVALELIRDEMGYESEADLEELPDLALILKGIARDIYEHSHQASLF